MEGEIPVRFTIDRAGRILSAHLLKSSGSPALDEAAVAMVRRSDPRAAAMSNFGDQALTMTVPVVFRARSRVESSRLSISFGNRARDADAARPA